MPKPEGTWDGKRLKIAVAFDEGEFNRIAAMAEQNKISFSEQIRRLCREGKDDSESRR